MTKTDIMKVLYKKQPKAWLTFIRKGVMVYRAEVEGQEIFFDVPANDTGDATFQIEMEAKHLSRWIVAE